MHLGGQDGWAHDEGHAAGTFLTFDRFQVGGPPRTLHVFLPRDGRPAPALVCQDGHTAFFGTPSWRVPEALDEGARTGRVAPLVAVAVHPLDRDREYTHAPWEDGVAWGGLDGYVSWVADALVPWLSVYLPVEGRALAAGVSHGALAAFALATRRPDVFEAAACLSTSLWVGVEHGIRVRREDGSLEGSALWASARPVLADPARRPRLWLDWGLVDDGRAARRGREAASLLATLGYVEGRDLFTFEDPHGRHDERAWAFRIRLALEALRPGPRGRPLGALRADAGPE